MLSGVVKKGQRMESTVGSGMRDRNAAELGDKTETHLYICSEGERGQLCEVRR